MERSGSGSDTGDDELGEVGDEFAILTIAAEGDFGSAVDLNRLGIINGEDTVADRVLPVQVVVRRR